MIEKNTPKVYVVAERTSTSGGPESLHQLVQNIAQLGLETYIYYEDSTDLEVPEKFVKYNISVASYIEDKETNILIVPESYTEVLYRYKHIRKCIWWLSLDFYLSNLPKNRTKNFSKRYKIPKYLNSLSFLGLLLTGRLKLRIFKFGKEKNEIFHFYNCEYVKEHLLEKGVREENILYLCGPLRDEFFDFSQENVQKENIIAYNPAKGYEFTKNIIDRATELSIDATFIPIKNMKPHEIVSLLTRAKMYIDFGFFPGPERIPREAVMLRCNIITGKTGSAKNNIDVPIPKECKFENRDENIDDIVRKIEGVLYNYNKYLPMYDDYRLKVIKQKKIFNDNIKHFFMK